MWQPAKGLQLAALLAIREPFDEPQVRADQTTIEFREVRRHPKRYRFRSTGAAVESRRAGLSDWRAVQRPRLSRPERDLDVLTYRGKSITLVQGADPAQPEGDGVFHDLERWKTFWLASTPIEDVRDSMVPLFVAQGTRDDTTLSADLFALEAIRHDPNRVTGPGVIR
jgi:hypothetical protein